MSRILVVEDSPTQAERLSAILEDAGYEPVLAADGEKALALIGQNVVDLVISDIVMPGLTGYELCRRLKSDPVTATVPVMLLSTLSEPMDIIRGLECGADNFLTKPYQADHLVGRVRNILGNRAMRAAGRVSLGIEILFLGNRFTISSDRQQILDLLISTFEETVRANRELQRSRAELAAAKSELERYAVGLEEQVRERTSELSAANHALEAEVAVHRETEHELVRTRTFLDHVIENIPAMVFVKDTVEGRYLLWNKGSEAILGYGRDDVLGRRDSDLFAPEQATLFVDGDREALRIKSVFTRAEIPVKRRDGTARLLRSIKVPVNPGDGGRPGYVLGLAEDITDRKELESQLLHATKLDAIGRLTGGIAHDFNNILGIIIGSLDLLSDRIADDPEAVELTREGLASAERGAELTRRMLAFARKQSLQPRALNLNEIIETVTPMLRRTLGADVNLITVLAEGLPSAFTDATQVENAILNLAVNARDAMPEGGRLIIETAEVRLDDDYADQHAEVATGAYVMLSVTDTGTGMPPATVEQAFEPFFTTKEVGRGTGLGLSMIYGFAKQSHGHAKIYSEVGHGTTVKLYLPVTDAVVSRKPAATDASLEIGSGERILLVEDDPVLRRIACRMLSELAYDIVEAEDGPSALRMLDETGPVDLLFTDLIMPNGLDGYHLAESARQRVPGLKVLFTSGYSERFVQNGPWHALAEPLLVKPYRKQELAHKIRVLLDAPAS